MAGTSPAPGTSIELELQNAAGTPLAATFTGGASDSAVLLLHGFLSDRRAGGRYDTVAAAYADAGHAVLRIDFSGFGESGGDAVDGDHLLLDAEAALSHLDSLGFTRQAIHGHSLGSAVALRVVPHRPRIRTLVLTGALTGAGFGDVPYPFLTEKQLQAWWRDEDVHLPLGQGATAQRSHVTVNRTRPRVGRFGSQAELLGALAVPVLIIHGDTGAQEQALVEITRQGEHLLPVGSRIEVIPGAEHTFAGQIDTVAELGRDWVSGQV